MINKQANGHAAYKRGLWAEAFCRLVLFLKGYRIVARRYKTSVGEIDLIAKKGRALVFVEVKARHDIETASYALQPRQQARLEKAAACFLAKNTTYNMYDQRFDVMLVVPRKWPRHIKQAW